LKKHKLILKGNLSYLKINLEANLILRHKRELVRDLALRCKCGIRYDNSRLKLVYWRKIDYLNIGSLNRLDRFPISF